MRSVIVQLFLCVATGRWTTKDPILFNGDALRDIVKKASKASRS